MIGYEVQELNMRAVSLGTGCPWIRADLALLVSKRGRMAKALSTLADQRYGTSNHGLHRSADHRKHGDCPSTATLTV